MAKVITTGVCGVLAVLLGVTSASAQMLQWEDIGFINVGVGFQGGSQTVVRQFTFPYFEEDANVEVTRELKKGGAFFDITGGGRVTGNIGAAINVMRRSKATDGTFTASIPDLAVFGQPRLISDTVPGMAHRETWFAILGAYVIPMTDKIDIFILAGPSMVNARHEVVTGASVTETGGDPQLDLTRQSFSKTFWGFQGGVDVRYLVTRQYGVGGFIRYNGASGDITDGVKLELGGFQAGLGARVRF